MVTFSAGGLTARQTTDKISRRLVTTLQGAGFESKAYEFANINPRTVALTDWTTYFLAKLNLVDPAETKIIEKLKK